MAIVLRSECSKFATSSHTQVCADADPASFREFVFRCALAVCGEPDGAEDVAQEVLLVLYRSKNRLKEFDSATAWVRKVTVRAATRHLKRKRSTDPLPEGLRSAEPSADTIAVYDVLRRLEPEHRALLGMALNQGLSYREIGEALDIPEGTVASRLNTAKKAFQRMWEQ